MTYSPAEIKKAALALSERYRLGTPPYLRSRIDRYAYLVTRFPATKAAASRVFLEISGFPIQSMLDIGAGPGTSWSAAEEIWPSLKATLIELDRDFVEIGSQTTPRDRVQWVTTDIKKAQLAPHDLVVFSYSWNEILDFEVLEKAWTAAQQFLVIVEPGTPRGYENMLKARAFCIEHGGRVFAPCPHSKACPWEKKGEKTEQWCHFAVRLSRTSEHRLAKEGSLGHEDEKISYIIVGKHVNLPSISRLVKDLQRRKGHTLLTLCTDQGIRQEVVTKKNKEFYKKVNKLNWGDKIINSV